MLPWITISSRPSTHFFNQEMAFFFARSKKDPSLRAPFSRGPLKPLQPSTKVIVSKVQQDIAVFQKRQETARQARSKQKTF